MKYIVLYLLLLCPMDILAQSTTDQVVDSIMNYLAMNSLDGLFVMESNGRNHACRGEITIDNEPMGATRKVLYGIRPYIDQLPHLRKMTEEQAGEVFEGRIAMRLHPEQGDTSAYFLMTYNRSKLAFKYGVNSPGSINLAKSSANGPGVGFFHKELSATEANPIILLFDEYSQRSDALVADTIFQYDGDKDYEWWLGTTDESSRTKARIVLLPSKTYKEIEQWRDVVSRYNRHDNVTTSLRNSVWHGKPYLVSVICTFTVNGAFHLYLAGHYQGQFCLIRVVAHPGEPCGVVPGFARLIEHLTGTEQMVNDVTGNPTKLIELMEKELQRRKSQPHAQVIDTLFVSNDHEGHMWWKGIDHPCPTHAHLVRTPSSKKDFDALHQRIRKTLNPTVSYRAWTDDGEEDERIFLGWMDEQRHYHAYIIYYMIATQQVIIERADSEGSNSICIPHYSQEWFDERPLSP